MNNLIGLEDQGWFKIVNTSSNLVIEVSGTKLICNPEDSSKEEIQTFKATILPDGAFSISSKFQSSNAFLQVWDYLPHRKLLVQRKQSSGRRNNQSWVSHHIPGFQSTYFMISAPDCEKCLKCVGEGNQVQIVDKSASIIGDSHAHWKLVQLGPVLAAVPEVEMLPEASLVPILPVVPIVLPQVMPQELGMNQPEEPMSVEMPEPEEPMLVEGPKPEVTMLIEVPKPEVTTLEEVPKPEVTTLVEVPKPEVTTLVEVPKPEVPMLVELPKPEVPMLVEVSVPEVLVVIVPEVAVVSNLESKGD